MVKRERKPKNIINLITDKIKLQSNLIKSRR